jgi:hypothetical protein
MPALTQLLALTRLLRLAWPANGSVDPLAGPPLELVTEDGIYLLTEDGNYIGVGVGTLGPVLLWSAQELFWGDEPLTWSPV